MKRKILCLLLALACLVTLLVSCKKEPDPTPCEGHVDADVNSACDNCGIPVFNVIQTVPAEDNAPADEMVIATIPEGATLKDVYNLAAPADDVIDAVTDTTGKFNYDEIDGLDEDAYLFGVRYEEVATENEAEPAKTTYTTFYGIYSLVEGKYILTHTSNEYIKDDKTTDVDETEDQRINTVNVEVFAVYGLIEVNETVWTKVEDEEDDDAYWSSDVITAYYTFNGELVAKDEVIKNETDNYVKNVGEPELYYYGNRGEYTYFTIDDTIYVMAKDFKIVHSAELDTFVDRPVNMEVVGDYGYVYNYYNDTVYVYDLTKWIECVYSYKTPAKYYTSNIFYLANGNVLVQALMEADEDNYDLTMYGNYFKLDYLLVDVAEKKVSEINFGYYINEVDTKVGDEYVDGIKNIITATTIADKELDTPVLLVCDDALAIKANVYDVVPELVEDLNVTVLAENRVLYEVVYGHGSTVSKIFNEKGEVVKTLPNSYELEGGAIKVGQKYYDFDMNVVFDLSTDLDPAEDAEKFYNLYYAGEDYILLTLDGDVFYWTLGLAAPQPIADLETVEGEGEAAKVVQRQSLVRHTADYYIVQTVKIGAAKAEDDTPIDVVTYVLYNENGEVVLNSDYAILDVNTDYSSVYDCYVCAIVTEGKDGNVVYMFTK